MLRLSLRGAKRRGNLINCGIATILCQEKGGCLHFIFFYEIATLPPVARNDIKSRNYEENK